MIMSLPRVVLIKLWERCEVKAIVQIIKTGVYKAIL